MAGNQGIGVSLRPEWRAVYEAVGRCGDRFWTGDGWWSNGMLAMRLGPVAKPRTAWEVECSCEDRMPACCTDLGHELGIECDSEHCQRCDFYPGSRTLWLAARLAPFWKQERLPLRWGGHQRVTFPDGSVIAVVQATAQGSPVYLLQQRFIDAVEQFVTPQTWELSALSRGGCMGVGFAGGQPVAAVMSLGIGEGLKDAVITDLPWPAEGV